MVLLLLLCKIYLLRLNCWITALDDLFDNDDNVAAVRDVIHAKLNMGSQVKWSAAVQRHNVGVTGIVINDGLPIPNTSFS